MQNKKLRFLVLGILCNFLALSAASAAPGDYDNDGLSDLAVAQVDRNAKTTAFLAKLSNGAPSLFWTFGVAADALVAGKFFGDGKTYPGVVYVRDAGLPLHWFIKSPTGADTFLLYGLPGDRVANIGPDFDGDGISDLYVVRDGRPGFFQGYKLWYIAMSSAGGMVQETVFGLSSDLTFAADLDGNGKAEMIALRPNTYEWFGKEVYSNTISAVQWGLPSDIPLLPQDLNGDGSAEYMISRIEGTQQVAYIRFANGSTAREVLGSSTSLPMVGNFANHVSFAWQERSTGWAAVRLRNGSDAVFPHGTSTNAVIRPDGTVVQPNETGRVGSNPTAPGPNPTPQPPSGECTSPRFPDGGGGALWKPDREGGSSGGDATFLVPPKSGSLTNSVVIYGSDGSVVHNMKLRYHGGNGGRSVWDATVSNTTLAAKAPLTVQSRYSNGLCENRSVPNPRSRYD